MTDTEITEKLLINGYGIIYKKECIMPEVELTCKFCNENFKYFGSKKRVEQRKYCSLKCHQLDSKREFIDFNFKRYYLEQSGYYKTCNNSKYYHRELWISHNGDVPDNFVIHHKDGDSSNNDINNLELVNKDIHRIHHRHGHLIADYCHLKYCKESDCNNRVLAQDLCSKHYQRKKAKELGYWP